MDLNENLLDAQYKDAAPLQQWRKFVQFSPPTALKPSKNGTPPVFLTASR